MNSPTSQTSPPPSPLPQTTAPAAPESSGPGLSEPQRLINVFIAPSKTFADLKRNPSWWAPWLVAAFFSLLFAFAATQKIEMVRIAREQIDQIKFVQQQFDQLPKEQQQQQLRIRAAFTKVTFYFYPLINFLFVLIAAALLMGVFNFGFAAEVPFKRSLAIVFYATLPAIVSALLLAGSIWFSSDPDSIDIMKNPLATNPGFFMDPNQNKFLYGVATGMDLIRLWICVP